VTQIRSRRFPTKFYPIHYSLRRPPTLHTVVQKSCDMGGIKLNFQVNSVPFSITWATDSNKVKIKFTLEQAWKAQRVNNVSPTLSLTSNSNIKQNISLSYFPCQLFMDIFLPSYQVHCYSSNYLYAYLLGSQMRSQLSS
jgi:hypothetical protein